jgi:hypothetical protein
MIFIRTWFNLPPDDPIPSSAASLICGRAMFAENRDWLRMLGLTPKPSWAEVWHVWTVIMPRRSITGRLLMGQVWRRHDGRRWIYKKYIE